MRSCGAQRPAAVPIGLAQADLADGLTAWAVERQPRMPADDRAADRRRQEHFGAATEPRVPDIDDLAGEAISRRASRSSRANCCISSIICSFWRLTLWPMAAERADELAYRQAARLWGCRPGRQQTMSGNPVRPDGGTRSFQGWVVVWSIREADGAAADQVEDSSRRDGPFSVKRYRRVRATSCEHVRQCRPEMARRPSPTSIMMRVRSLAV